MQKDFSQRYPGSLRWLHWLGFAAVILAYLFISLTGLFGKDDPLQTVMLQAHFAAGLAVLILVLPRFFARWFATVPPISPQPSKITHLAAASTHILLYAFLLLQPLLGLGFMQLAGKTTPLPGGWEIPVFLVVKHPRWAHTLEEIHVILGTIFFWVIGLHIAAAIWHHWRVRDNTLQRML